MIHTIVGWFLLGLAAACVFAAGEAILWDAVLKRHRPFEKRFASYLFVVYLVVFVRLSVAPGVNPGMENAGIAFNLVPLASIIRYFDMLFAWTMPLVFAGNVIGNLLLLLPMGFFLPLFKPDKLNWRKIFILSAVLSIAIELVQLLFAALKWDSGRVVDIDDVLMNALGGLMGYWLYLLFRGIIGKCKKKNEESNIERL